MTLLKTKFYFHAFLDGKTCHFYTLHKLPSLKFFEVKTGVSVFPSPFC